MARLTALALLLGVLLAACTGCAAATAVTTSGIEGVVRIGPMCPAVQVGERCPDPPYQAELSIVDSDGRAVAEVQSDANGQFRVGLAPGQYTVVPQPEPGGIAFAHEQQVVVQEGQFTAVLITYDSGIR